MNEIYTADNDNLQVAVSWYPIDGVQITISTWDGDDFHTRYDKRVIADSLWEAMGSAMTEALGIEWEQADAQLAEWGIFQPDDEEGDE